MSRSATFSTLYSLVVSATGLAPNSCPALEYSPALSHQPAAAAANLNI